MPNPVSRRADPGQDRGAGCARGRLESWDKWSFSSGPPAQRGDDPGRPGA